MTQNFNENLKLLRTKKGLTQQKLAAKTDIALSMYQKYEYGKSVPNMNNLIKIANILEITLDELCGRSEIERERGEAE